MSIDYGLYIGPYAQCVVGTVETTQLIYTCPNVTCQNHGDRMYPQYLFCSSCGNRFVTTIIPAITDAIDHWIVSDQIKEALAAPSGDAYIDWKDAHHVHIWLPNHPQLQRNGYLDDHKEYALTPIEPTQIATEVQECIAAFADELAVLRRLYGNDAVTIGWGVIQDYS